MEIQDFCYTTPVIDIDNPDFITTKKVKKHYFLGNYFKRLLQYFCK